MSSPGNRIEADYTRGGWLFRGPMTPGRAVLVLVVVVVLSAALLPLDGPMLAFTKRFQDGGDLEMGGDLRRELLFVQQWGDVVCTALVLTAVWLLDRTRRARLWDALIAVGLTALAYQTIKLVAGRPRPLFDEPYLFLGPLRTHLLTRHGETLPYHAWEFWRPIRAELWSMPSSHTAAAACLSIVLMRLYPRLTPLVAGLAIIVGVCRVVLAAHYPTDVVVGLGIGLVVASLAMDRGWGRCIAGRLGVGPQDGPGETRNAGA